MAEDTTVEGSDTYGPAKIKEECCVKAEEPPEMAGPNKDYVSCHLYEPLGG